MNVLIWLSQFLSWSPTWTLTYKTVSQLVYNWVQKIVNLWIHFFLYHLFTLKVSCECISFFFFFWFLALHRLRPCLVTCSLLRRCFTVFPPPVDQWNHVTIGGMWTVSPLCMRQTKPTIQPLSYPNTLERVGEMRGTVELLHFFFFLLFGAQFIWDFVH